MQKRAAPGAARLVLHWTQVDGEAGGNPKTMVSGRAAAPPVENSAYLYRVSNRTFQASAAIVPVWAGSGIDEDGRTMPDGFAWRGQRTA